MLGLAVLQAAKLQALWHTVLHCLVSATGGGGCTSSKDTAVWQASMGMKWGSSLCGMFGCLLHNVFMRTALMGTMPRQTQRLCCCVNGASRLCP
jgi:hypothetical protein